MNSDESRWLGQSCNEYTHSPANPQITHYQPTLEASKHYRPTLPTRISNTPLVPFHPLLGPPSPSPSSFPPASKKKKRDRTPSSPPSRFSTVDGWCEEREDADWTDGGRWIGGVGKEESMMLDGECIMGVLGVCFLGFAFLDRG